MRVCIAVFAILVVLCAASAFYFFTGRYNVAAVSPHWPITVEALKVVREHSIERHSTNIRVPQPLNTPELQKIGFHHYHEMCRLCHGAPGYQRTEFARGLYPRPPDLASKKIRQLSDAQLYWIIKNGIKMTGMPAFGVTHTKKQMWGIVAFLRVLPKLGPAQYAHMVEMSKEGK